MKIDPFLKWAGGKRWLVSKHLEIFPRNFKRYVEPFLGSGAIFFALAPQKALLSDSNKDLIETYQAISDNWENVYRYLLEHQQKHSEKYYYQVRDTAFAGRYARAARFIYLNRTCWNALYRVNRKGKFNVPIGTKTSVLLPSDDFAKIATRLSTATLIAADFQVVIDRTKDGDLLYVDPPYTIKHGNNGFIKYNEHLFQWSDQERLKDALVRARRRGVFVIVSNACHSSIFDLYKGFEIFELKRSSVLAAKSMSRGTYSEYLIVGAAK